MIYKRVDEKEEKNREYVFFSPSHLETEREKSGKKQKKQIEIARKYRKSMRKIEVQ